MKPDRRSRMIGRALIGGLLALIMAAAAWEIKTSRIQARVFSRMARRLAYQLSDGPSTAIRFPTHGPYDARLGYVRIPEWQARLTTSGYEVAAQARWSPELLRHVDKGRFPIYPER